MLQCRSGHARTTPATLGLGDGPRAVTARTSPREPARRATAPRLRDRSGGPPAARAKHAPSTRNTQHATWRPATREMHRSSEMGPAVSCVCSVRYP